MGKHHEQDAIRRYLLNQLSDSEQQRIEFRLLSDGDFSEELDFVEDELIDEYIGRELSEPERLSFEENFLAHPERKRKLEAGQALKRYLDTTSLPTPKPTGRLNSLRKWLNQLFFSSPAGVVVTALVIAVVGLGIWRGVSYRSDLEKGLIALNEAYSEQRPTEARVSNIRYARFITTRRNEPKPVNEIELRRADRFLNDAFDRSAESYHAMGKLFLLQGNPNKAIEYLDQAGKVDQNNPTIYADLGAAYFEKGKQEQDSSTTNDQRNGNDLETFGRSVEYLNQALELDPNLLEALFNKALVHQHQKLFNLAKSDWRAYLERDSSSQWAVEAKKNLKDLEEPKELGSQNSDKPLDLFMLAYRARDDDAAWDIYRQKYAPAGNAVTNALIHDILANNLNSQLTESRKALNYLGRLGIRKAQDSYTSDLSKAYATASTRDLKLLNQAQQQLAEGYDLLSRSRIEEANKFFVSAMTTFQKAGNLPETLAAQIAIVHGAVVEPDLPKARELLAQIITICESRNYKWLLAQTLSHQAHLQSNLNNFSQAISDGDRALQIFQELNDVSGTVRTFIQQASLNLSLNDVETSFSYLKRGLALTNDVRVQPAQLWGLHVALSLNLHVLKLYRAALDYQNEALLLVLRNSKAALYHSRSYRFLGLTYASLRRFDLAVKNLQLAYEQGRLQASERSGQNMMADASLGLGDVYRHAGDTNKALKAYDEGLRLYEELGFDHYQYLYAAHKGKFLCYRAQNDDAMGARELQIVIDLFDQYREKILDERQKNLFFDREQDTYDLAIDFTYSQLGDERRAFDYSETSRARNLRDLMQHGAEVTHSDRGLDLRVSKDSVSKKLAPLTAMQVKDKVHERLQLVQFAVLEKKLLIWHITRTSFFAKSVPVESAQLAELVTTARKQIRQRDQNGATASLKSLYGFLIEPIKEKLDQNRVLCFVPDEVLHFVPFNAMISANNGHYLAQDFRVLVSPSATILIDSTENATSRPSENYEHILAVGDPAFDRQANPNLRNLPEARREVEVIAENYDDHNVLSTERATRTAILAHLPKADVAHFAAHYEIDPRSSLLSRLLLAPERGESAHAQPSGLMARDIYRIKLKRLKLVILAGCTTGIDQQFSGEGPIGFARSFLVAGVPVVVASLWPVDSDATAKLMIVFHRYRRTHHSSTTEALMHAQQELMSQENYNDPYFWAGFVVVGGYSDF